MERKKDVKILVVDDEDYMREVVRTALEGAGTKWKKPRTEKQLSR